MPLTDSEKEQIRYHLGYMETQPAASIQLGIPRPIQTMFLVEDAMSLILEIAIPRVRAILDALNKYELRLNPDCVSAYLAAEKLGELTLRSAKLGETYPDLLEREYVRWAKRLADVLGVPLYPYSDRFKNVRNFGNIPVRN